MKETKQNYRKERQEMQMSRIEKAIRYDELIDFQTLARESARQEEERVLAEELHHVSTWSETIRREGVWQ